MANQPTEVDLTGIVKDEAGRVNSIVLTATGGTAELSAYDGTDNTGQRLALMKTSSTTTSYQVFYFSALYIEISNGVAFLDMD